MLAKLQRWLMLCALLLAVAWAAWATRAGHPLWALAGVALVLGGHALVLALEFVLLRLVHGHDPAPRASAGDLLRAWWGELLCATRVFCWRQPFRSHRWPDRLPAGTRGRRGVLLVHGFACNRGLWNPWLARLTAQGTPVVAVNLEPVFGSIDAYARTIESGVQQLEQCTGLPPVIVAHSMGGLAVRGWWGAHDGDSRVRHCITIGTPHQGTWLARFAVSVNARQMQLRSPWLLALAGCTPLQRARRFTCFYGNCDNIVFPPSAGTLHGADNRLLCGTAHVHMVDRPEPWTAVQAMLAAGEDLSFSPDVHTPPSGPVEPASTPEAAGPAPWGP